MTREDHSGEQVAGGQVRTGETPGPASGIGPSTPGDGTTPGHGTWPSARADHPAATGAWASGSGRNGSADNGSADNGSADDRAWWGPRDSRPPFDGEAMEDHPEEPVTGQIELAGSDEAAGSGNDLVDEFEAKLEAWVSEGAKHFRRR